MLLAGGVVSDGPRQLHPAAEPAVDESAQLLAELVQFTPAPGPAGRVQRTAGQAGAVLVALELWLAFGWLGADGWNERQLLAVSSAAYVVASALQNIGGYLSGRKATRPT